MAWSCSVDNAKVLRTWQQAHEYFGQTKLPRSKYWTDDNERPMYNTASHHMRVVANSDDSYGLYLYQTELVRYYKPDADGKHLVQLEEYDSSAPREFLWRQGWGYRDCYWTTCGKRVMLPNRRNARLVLTADGKLVLAESTHEPVFSRSTSKDLSAKRKQLRKAFEVLIDMIPMKFAQVQQEWFGEQTGTTVAGPNGQTYTRARKWRGSGPFAGVHAEHEDVSQMRAAWSAMQRGETPDDTWVQAGLNCLLPVFHTLVSRRDDGEEKVTQEALERAFTGFLIRTCGLDRADTRVQLPMWQEDYPRNSTT